MGGRGASSASKTSGPTSYRARAFAALRKDAESLNGTDAVDAMRNDSNFNRLGWRTRANYQTAESLESLANGKNMPLGASSDDKAVIQKAAQSVTTKYGARKAAAFYTFGHRLRGAGDS
jgi:hypothetical protein